jgi:NADPH:quinone reductase-like Zn-dependent oxidoreductase
MRAYVVKEFGLPGAVEERAMPRPGERELLVRVRAAGVNAMDAVVVAGYVKAMMEHRFPLTPGIDVSGVIEAIGPGITGWKAGDEVFGASEKPYMGDGTFGEYVVVGGGSIIAKPTHLDHSQAAALPTASLTALSAVNEIAPQQGQTVVILGATGGVGSFATQLVALRGARVIAVTRSEYAEYAQQLGASASVDYTVGDPVKAVRATASSIDAILDLAGDAALLEGLVGLLRAGASVISSATRLDPEAYKARGLKGKMIMRAPLPGLTEIVRLIEEKRLRMPTVRTLPLEKAADALAEQAQRHTRGKLVLTVS